MAQLEVNGISELIRDLDSAASDSTRLCQDMLTAQADIVQPALKRSLESTGAVRTGRLRDSIIRRKGRGTGGPLIRIGPRGEHHRYLPRKGKSGIVQAGYVGYINEYGIPGRGIKARRWALRAVAESEDQAAAAAEKTYDNYLKSHNL